MFLKINCVRHWWCRAEPHTSAHGSDPAFEAALTTVNPMRINVKNASAIVPRQLHPNCVLGQDGVGIHIRPILSFALFSKAK